MADVECVQLLSFLHMQLGPVQFEQAKLFLQCIGLGGEHLDSAQDLLDMYRIVSSDQKYSEALAVAIVKFILLEIGVADAEQLIATSDNIQKALNLLMFPTLLTELCRRLGHDDYRKFKGCICSAVLMCNPECIQSRVDLMKKLLHQTAISSGNVDVLIKWLSTIGRKDLTKIVEEYKLKSLHQSTLPNSKAAKVVSPGASECLQENAEQADPNSQLSRELVLLGGSQESQPVTEGNGAEPTSTMMGKISLIVDKIRFSKRDLNRRVLEIDLEHISKLIPEHWNQFVGLSADAQSSLIALWDWYRREAGNATYRVLVEDFLSKDKTEIAEQVCRMAKVVRFQCPTRTPQQCHENTIPAPGVVPPGNLWDPSTVKELKVYFMNAGVLCAKKMRWQCGNNGLEQMNTKNILDWATGGWKSDRYKSYPRISSTAALKIEDSHIRVWFADTPTVGNRCWSYVGKDANNHPGEMTMFLDLFNVHQPDQQSLVIHEFGHALGMEHEHQRSDFWKVLDGLLKDKHNLPGACAEHRVSNTASGNYDYDPMSIMHYWFDKTWLKDEYQVDDLSKVEDIPGLLLEQKKVIRGVHIRDYRNGRLVKEASEGDFKALDAEYKKLAAKQK